jgi:hypothetical protein
MRSSQVRPVVTRARGSLERMRASRCGVGVGTHARCAGSGTASLKISADTWTRGFVSQIRSHLHIGLLFDDDQVLANNRPPPCACRPRVLVPLSEPLLPDTV